MNGRFLRNKTDLLEWKKEYFGSCQSFVEPLKYPCWARTEVENWNYQEVGPVYMYREDVVALLAEFDN